MSCNQGMGKKKDRKRNCGGYFGKLFYLKFFLLKKKNKRKFQIKIQNNLIIQFSVLPPIFSKCIKDRQGHTYFHMNSKPQMCDVYRHHLPTRIRTVPTACKLSKKERRKKVSERYTESIRIPLQRSVAALWHFKFIIIFRLLHSADLAPSFFLGQLFNFAMWKSFRYSFTRGLLISSSTDIPALLRRANNATLKHFPQLALFFGRSLTLT